jgi:hypothetical protein
MATTDMVDWLVTGYGLEPWAAHVLISLVGIFSGFIVLYGAWKTRGIRHVEGYLRGDFQAAAFHLDRCSITQNLKEPSWAGAQ